MVDTTTRHDDGDGGQDNGKGQNGDGRHDDGKGQNGDGQHDSNARHEDGDPRLWDGGAVNALDCDDGRGIAGVTTATTMGGPGDVDVEAIGRFTKAGRL